jgi:hypothetical protein
VAIVFALPRLYQAVVARFSNEGLGDVAQSFGWLASAEQMRSTKRIVWTPGDDSGNLGAVAAPRQTNGNGRQLATLIELCTVEISSYDSAAPVNELAQYQGARELYDAWLSAVEREAHGTYLIVSSKWVGGDRARRAGAAIRVVLSLRAPIVGTPRVVAPVDTVATLHVTDLDVTESTQAEPA